MKALIDTNILIDYLQTSEKAAEELNRYDEILVSRITWIEFLVGAKESDERTIREDLLQRFSLLEIDQTVAQKTVEIRQTRRMDLPDAIILATARVNGLLLVTRNHRDFSRRDPDIRIPY